jgi:cob(I)alamin adenosyltransferase
MARKITPKKFAELSAGVRLSSHERICAERQKHILDSIQELNKEVKSLRQDVLKGKGVVSALVFIGSCVVAIIGFFKFNG